MFINKDNFILDTDCMLVGFTFRDLMDVANANGEGARQAFEDMLSECVENAREMFDAYEADITDLMNKHEEGDDG